MYEVVAENNYNIPSYSSFIFMRLTRLSLSFVDSKKTTGVGPKKTTGPIYPSPVAYMYILPWAVPSTAEMLLHASSIDVSSPELDQGL